MLAPRIATRLPGPRARAIIGKDRRYASPSYNRAYPLVVKRGLGAVIEDVDGNRFLDFCAGIAVCSTGHSHPRVVKAVKTQAEQFLHMAGVSFYYPAMAQLAEKLSRITPGRRAKRVYFGNSGTETIEAAIKLAHQVKKRPNFLAFMGGFHGRTMGGLSLTASKAVQRRSFSPLLAGVHHVPYGNCYRCVFNLKYPSCGFDCIRYIEDVVFKSVFPPEDIAALVIEPIQGEGGVVVPPPEYHAKLKALAEKYGILFIADEIQTGMGRTGKMFALEHWGVVPDMICIAKGIASGMPLGALVAPADLMTWTKGSHASTFGGNPVSCAAALETIRLIEEGLLANARTMGERLLDRLRGLPEEDGRVGEVTGKGLLIGMEIVRDRKTKEPDAELRDRVLRACFQNGLLLLPCGASRIRFSPPLVVNARQVDRAVGILREALRAA